MGNSASTGTGGPDSAFEESDAGRRILLISDNLDKPELLVQAAADSVIVVPMKYDSWTLDELMGAVISRAGQPAKQFASVGILDHGEPDELCLLREVGGGILGFREIIGNEIIEDFFRFLASYVMAPPPGTHRMCPEYRIDLMACSLADQLGTELIDHLEGILAVNVWASIDDSSPAADVKWSVASEPDTKAISDWYFDEDYLQLWEISIGKHSPDISMKKATRKSSTYKQMAKKPEESADVKIRVMERHRMIWKTKSLRERALSA